MKNSTTWVKIWSGKWSLLSCSYYGDQFTRTIKDKLGVAFTKALYISHGGMSIGYLDQDDLKHFGEILAEHVKQDKTIALRWCDEIKRQTDNILSITRSLEDKKISSEDYHRFVQALYDYAPEPRAIKFGPDYIPSNIMEELVQPFSNVRLYSDSVYVETEKLTERFAAQIAEEAGVQPEDILSLTQTELEHYFVTKALPNREILQQRFQNGALLYDEQGEHFLTGESVARLEKEIEASFTTSTSVQGKTAFPGKATGRVRIVFQPTHETAFDPGDILITGMTRPEYLSLIQKSAAFVTDAGGMLSHAAITARELKKPCIVGTQVATKIFKDGDMVEVDADQGIVRKI